MSEVTKPEFLLLNKTAELHNDFVALERLHPHEMQEWVSKLHDLQRIVMCRIAQKEHMDYFNSLIIKP